ncbi:hypothetical protein CDL15_Pgr008474 [Punica granatum]|uniref:Large ribosomal RNA subunit accumulation protein YCED homolog 1, chloroplastic n=1 Tax=Punica granatum TaxID=22663 RepID=A0A218WNH0_PUNGR|nr:hypothetical protein CDL15_Pgr008474 [Punica granatum]
MAPCHSDHLGTSTSKSHRLASPGRTFFVSTRSGAPCLVKDTTHRVFRPTRLTASKSSAVASGSQPDTDNALSIDWGEQELDGTEELDSPWGGAIIYRRNSSVSHVEYCTTLERLGLEKLSTDTSKLRASALGLRVTKSVKDYPLGTPVLISVDVTRRKNKLRLDGIIRTVITLGCNRCGEPAAESVFSNFSILLTNEPIEEPKILSLGTISGEDKSKSSPGFIDKVEEGDADETEIDMDDWLHFPPEEKQIDLSKNIRDLVHLEITLNAVCDPSCKGLCLKCGTNLNTSMCSCSKSDARKKSFGPLGNLKKQMQQL